MHINRLSGPALRVMLIIVLCGGLASALDIVRNPTRAGETGAKVKLDLNGVPLPSGAIGRLGTAPPNAKTVFATPAHVAKVMFTPDGSKLVSIALDKTVRVWDVATLKPAPTLRPMPWPHHWDLSPDGKSLLGLGFDLTVRRISLTNGKVEKTVALKSPSPLPQGWLPRLMHVLPDGETLMIVATEPTTKAIDTAGKAPKAAQTKLFSWWDLNTGALRTWGATEDAIEPGYARSVAVSPDGRFGVGLRKIFDTRTGQADSMTPATSTITPLGGIFSLDSRMITARSKNNGVAILCLPSRQTLIEIPQAVASGSAFSRDERYFARVGGNVLSAWDLLGSKSVLDGIVSDPPDVDTQLSSALAISPNSRILATGISDGTILLWPLAPPRKPKSIDGSELAKLWQDLRSENQPAAQRAIWRLAEDPETVIPFFKNHFPAKVEVDFDWRRQVELLDSDDFNEREQAMARLSTLTPGSEEGLRKALQESKSAEQKARLEILLAQTKTAASRENEQLSGMVAALEACGTVEARAALEDFSHRLSPLRNSREEAARALNRMRWLDNNN